MSEPVSPDHSESAMRLLALEEEIQLLRDFASLSSDWFWEQDAEFRFTRFFGNAPERLRRRQSDFIGKRRWEMPVSGVSQAQLDAHIATCQRHEAFHDFVYDIPGEDGLFQCYAISGMPIFDQTGTFTGYRGIGRNVTELRQAERIIADNERRLAQIFDASPASIFVLDAGNRVTHWNQACERLTGVPACAVIGSRDAWRGFYPIPRPTLADLVMTDNPDVQMETYYAGLTRPSRLISGAYEAENFFPKMADGGRWLFFMAAPLHDTQGAICGAIETLQDITARKTAELAERNHWEQLQLAHVELCRTMHQLVEAQKLASLGRLVAGISHELNTPLGNAMTVATALTDMIDSMAVPFAEGKLRRSELERLFNANRENSQLLLRSIARAGNLVAKFREIVAEPESHSPLSFSLRKLVQTIVGSFNKRLEDAAVQMEMDIPEDITLRSFPGALQEIFEKLLDNSLVHAFPGREAARITISAQANDGQVTIIYSDNGRGMSADVRHHAFDPFYTTRLGQGESGLGLYIAHNHAQGSLHGNIELLASAVDTGTTFQLNLPLQLNGEHLPPR